MKNFYKISFRIATLLMCWKLRRFEEIWGGITNIFEEICQNLAQNLRRIEEISHMYVLVNITFTNVMSSNITVYSRGNTTLTIGKKWTFNMKLCNLYYIILTIWTHIICAWRNPLFCINICKCTRLTILFNKNPTFFLYFMIQS